MSRGSTAPIGLRWRVLWLVVTTALLGAVATVAVAPTPATASDDEAVTVPAPGAGPGASVTVSKTTGLINESVAVSWQGFRPSSDSRLANAGDSLDINTERPVRVYECRGADPASSSDCYGSPGFAGVDASGDTPAIPAVPGFTYPGQTNKYDATPDGPANWQDNVTHPDGTGEVTIQVFTKRESAGLCCDSDSPCSIVVVPNYGRPAGASEDKLDAPWAWARRTVVPLTFQPVKDACPLAGGALRVEGSPMLSAVMASWRARTCTLDSDAVTLDYTAIGEPQTRSDTASGTTDVGLTIDPLADGDAAQAGIVYAPLSVTGLVVAFQLDDAEGKPITHLNLDARLVAKLVTASYRSGGDPAVIGNPVNVFHDPELLALNPGVDFPDGAPGNHPLLLGDTSDTTRALTRWLAADPDAAAFLAGQPDPWGMTVNSNYKGISLPFDTFPLLDEHLSSSYAPVQELDAVARQLSIAQFPGGSSVVEGGVNVTIKPARQNPGQREVIGIIDAAAAARFRLPTASLRNASGSFVAPNDASMEDAISHATVNPDGVTRSVDLTSTDPGIYPLTLQVSAALSTEASADERQQMADFLAYAVGPGQVHGDEVGQLPDGHAPLDATLLALAQEARTAVLAGPAPSASASPTKAGHTKSAAPSADPTSPSDAPSDGGGGDPTLPPGPTSVLAPPTAGPASAVPVAAAPTVAPAAMVTVASQVRGHRLMVLPALAFLALLSLGGGPVLLWLSQNGRGPQWLRR
jgi:ABC-type phosphate transport system substrate-binding protein